MRKKGIESELKAFDAYSGKTRGFTVSQIAGLRKDAFKHAQTALNKKWEASGAINPITGEEMTAEQQKEYVEREANKILDFSISNQAIGQQARQGL